MKPFIVRMNGTRDSDIEKHSVKSVDDPLPSIVASGSHFAVVQPELKELPHPFIVEFHSNGQARSIDEPLPTITTIDRFGLAEPVIIEDGSGKKWMLDVRFRMLQPHELARAMSFPDGYEFHGTRREKVKQIGNAVPVNTARQLIKEILRDYVEEE